MNPNIEVITPVLWGVNSFYVKAGWTKELLPIPQPPDQLLTGSKDVSFETIAATVQTDTAAALSQGVKVFLSPNVSIKAGSKLTVTQNGVTTAYKSSGVPAVYPTHQEIILTLFERWA